MKLHFAVIRPRLPRLALTLALPLLALGSAHAQSRFTVIADGHEVVDNRTGLTWRRCAEGLAFNGSTCAGSRWVFTHDTALAHARDQAGWRLPNVKELQTLVDKSQMAPSIDTSAFPGTPAVWFWTSTPVAFDSPLAWIVHFSNGGGVYLARRELYESGDGGGLRLVRGGQ